MRYGNKHEEHYVLIWTYVEYQLLISNDSHVIRGHLSVNHIIHSFNFSPSSGVCNCQHTPGLKVSKTILYQIIND